MKNKIIEWIKEWFENESGNAKGVILGISGGKDSTVVAKLCVEAIGKDKVFGVLMPNGEQKDIKDSIKVCNLLGINYITINIDDIFNSISDSIYPYMTEEDKFYFTVENDDTEDIFLSKQSKINIAPRIRMTVLYSIAQSMNYRVAGTGNATERFLGYFTKWGDGACDFNPIGNLFCTEVIKLGEELGLPDHLIHKAPSDGLTGKTDEEQFGFTYEEIDNAIKNMKDGGDNSKLFNFLKKSFNNNSHKLFDIPMPS